MFYYFYVTFGFQQQYLILKNILQHEFSGFERKLNQKIIVVGKSFMNSIKETVKNNWSWYNIWLSALHTYVKVDESSNWQNWYGLMEIPLFLMAWSTYNLIALSCLSLIFYEKGKLQNSLLWFEFIWKRISIFYKYQRLPRLNLLLTKEFPCVFTCSWVNHMKPRVGHIRVGFPFLAFPISNVFILIKNENWTYGFVYQYACIHMYISAQAMFLLLQVTIYLAWSVSKCYPPLLSSF